jgi:hypothetical protein
VPHVSSLLFVDYTFQVYQSAPHSARKARFVATKMEHPRKHRYMLEKILFISTEEFTTQQKEQDHSCSFSSTNDSFL